MNPLAAALLDESRDDPAALADLRALLGLAGPAVYTPQTLAAELGITPRAVRAAIERGDLEARRSGRGYVIGAEAVARWTAPKWRRKGFRQPVKSRPLGDALAQASKTR